MKNTILAYLNHFLFSEGSFSRRRYMTDEQVVGKHPVLIASRRRTVEAKATLSSNPVLEPLRSFHSLLHLSFNDLNSLSLEIGIAQLA